MKIPLIGPGDIKRIEVEVSLFNFGKYKRLVGVIIFADNHKMQLKEYRVYGHGKLEIITQNYTDARKTYNSITSNR